MTRIFVAIISYLVLTFTIAITWNLVLFRETYLALAAGSLRPEPIIPLGLLSVLTEAVAMSLLFHFYYGRSPGIKNAVILALSVGVFSMTYASFTVPAKFLISPVWQYLVLELSFGLLHYGLVGVVFFFIFKTRKV